MKRKLLVCVMALAAVFAVTGCGNKNNNNGGETTTTAAAEKKLSCTLTADGDTTRVNVTYDGDKISKATYGESKKVASEKEAKAQHEKNSKEVPEINKNKGVSANCSYSGTLVSTSLTFTVANLEETGKSLYDEMFSEIKDLNFDQAKEKLTSVGYTCK